MTGEHEEEFSRAHTPPKEEVSPVANTPTNSSRKSYDPRETGNIDTNHRAHDVSLTDNHMAGIAWDEIDWDILATPPGSHAPSRPRDGSEAFGDAADAQTSRPHTPSFAKQESHNKNMGVCTISQAEAVSIFLAGSRHGSYGNRGKLTDRLSKEFGITTKAVRDIWNLRTWARETRPHWTPLDEETFSKKKSRAALCNSQCKPTRQTHHNISKCTSRNSLTSQPDFQVPTCSNRFDGEWMIDPSFIALALEAVLMECNE